MNESEMQADIARLENVMSSLRDKVSDMDRDLGVTKHAVANVQQSQIDTLSDKLGSINTDLRQDVNAINTQQARGMGFFAGMAAVATVAMGLLLAFVRLLFAP